MRVSVLITLLPVLVSGRKLARRGPVVSYEGHKVYRVQTPEGESALERRVAGLRATLVEDHHPETWIDVIVEPESVTDFEALNLDSEVLHENLARDIEAEAVHKPYTKRQASDAPGLPSIEYFDSYHPYAEHIDFLEDLVAAFPNNAEMIVAGESYEGREIQGIHVWGASGNITKQAVYWHGTTHAREWISAMTSEYQLYQMVAGYLAGDEDVVAILDTYEFYLIPFVNPDGFIHTQTTERLWRKNRQPRCNETCIGTDLNRNWPQNWALPGGSSDDPCSQTFRGLRESDTPEVTSLTKHVLATAEAHPGGIKWFVDWHSYSQLVLLPYGHDCSARAHNHEYQMMLGAGIVDQIEAVNGTEYVYGPNCQTLYPITGGSADFVFDNANAEVSWLIELTPNSAGAGGFILPPERILPTVTEMWEGVRWVLKELTA